MFNFRLQTIANKDCKRDDFDSHKCNVAQSLL